LLVGVVTYAATLAAAWQLVPGPAARFLGRGASAEEGEP
jgi:hypothetical protein